MGSREGQQFPVGRKQAGRVILQGVSIESRGLDTPDEVPAAAFLLECDEYGSAGITQLAAKFQHLPFRAAETRRSRQMNNR